MHNTQKAAVITTLLMSVWLFYGNIRDAIAKTLHLTFLSRYSILLPLMIAAAIVTIIIIRRKKEVGAITLYLNLLLTIWLLVDAGKLISLKIAGDA
ncbi:MAG: hypothetical protein JST39_13570, partial [Bacteroidetes bacterium]|nr:hypothetical protein [Bacteroidota bacterium]